AAGEVRGAGVAPAGRSGWGGHADRHAGHALAGTGDPVVLLRDDGGLGSGLRAGAPRTRGGDRAGADLLLVRGRRPREPPDGAPDGPARSQATGAGGPGSSPGFPGVVSGAVRAAPAARRAQLWWQSAGVLRRARFAAPASQPAWAGAEPRAPHRPRPLP